MAQLDKNIIHYLTKLSRIGCSKEEEGSLLKDLESIVTYIEQLQEVNTDNVLPCNQVLEDLCNVMREDEVGNTLPREVFLSNASSHTGGMIRVPPVLKVMDS